MAITRPNILKSPTAASQYAKGVLLLKNEFPGPTTKTFGIDGASTKLSTYDLFVVWHSVAMASLTPPDGPGRNAAHQGPVFAPWHRFMLRQLEMNLQRVLGDNTFGLPYWDWAADGELPRKKQKQSPLWDTSHVGGSGNPVTTGPFAWNPDDSKGFRINVETDFNGVVFQSRRGLKRSVGLDQTVSTLPTKKEVAAALAVTSYDSPTWDMSSSGFRNVLEGWQANPAPGLHNRVHVWVGGDMSPASSPNDPVFFLNHCNVDRIWETWMQKHGRNYVPGQDADPSLEGHRINDELHSLISASARPADLLDVSQQYTYDALAN